MNLFPTDFSECEPHLHIMRSLFRSHCLITSIFIPSSLFLLIFVKHKLNIMSCNSGKKNSVSNTFHCYDLKIQVGTLVVAVPMTIFVGPPHCVNTFQ